MRKKLSGINDAQLEKYSMALYLRILKIFKPYPILSPGKKNPLHPPFSKGDNSVVYYGSKPSMPRGWWDEDEWYSH
jgi:hypothetical protein